MALLYRSEARVWLAASRISVFFVVMLAAACRDARLSASWQTPISGVVRTASGEPAAGAIVIFTPKMESRAEIVIADDRGRFVARIRNGDYAITASTSTGYVFRSVAVVSPPVDLVLDPDCAPIQGTVPSRTTGRYDLAGSVTDVETCSGQGSRPTIRSRRVCRGRRATTPSPTTIC